MSQIILYIFAGIGSFTVSFLSAWFFYLSFFRRRLRQSHSPINHFSSFSKHRVWFEGDWALGQIRRGRFTLQYFDTGNCNKERKPYPAFVMLQGNGNSLLHQIHCENLAEWFGDRAKELAQSEEICREEIADARRIQAKIDAGETP